MVIHLLYIRHLVHHVTHGWNFLRSISVFILSLSIFKRSASSFQPYWFKTKLNLKATLFLHSTITLILFLLIFLLYLFLIYFSSSLIKLHFSIIFFQLLSILLVSDGPFMGSSTIESLFLYELIKYIGLQISDLSNII